MTYKSKQQCGRLIQAVWPNNVSEPPILLGVAAPTPVGLATSFWSRPRRDSALGRGNYCPRTVSRSGVDDDLEPAIDHALHVEGHRLHLHLLCQARVLHHLRVHAIAMGA